MLITDQHTYPSPAPSPRPLIPRPVGRGLPRLPADSSWNGPHCRSRCTQGSRETDESTLRPEHAEKTLVLPSFDLFAAKAARARRRKPLAPLSRAPIYAGWCSNHRRLLCASFSRPISYIEG